MKLAALPRQIAIFLVVGGSAALANFGTGVLVRLISTSALVYGASVVLGMGVGTVVSFFLNRRYTFAVADQPAAPQAARYALVSIGGVLVTLTVAEAALGLWQLAGAPLLSRTMMEHCAHLAAIGLNTVYTFLAVKFFALKRRGAGAPTAEPGLEQTGA
jgi:putative flippase GtrA